MKSYIPPNPTIMSAITAQRCRLLVLPMKAQPRPRAKGSLLQGLGGLWVQNRDRSYRVCYPQSKQLDEAFPLGSTGSVVIIKEPLNKKHGVWCREDGSPVDLPDGDPRIPEMVAWAHHGDLDSCSARCMPRWAARYFLKIGKVYARRVVELTSLEAEAAGYPCGIEKLLAGLRDMIGEVEFKGSLWVWLAEVESCAPGGAG